MNIVCNLIDISNSRFEKLTRISEQFKPGELIVIASRPSVGKTLSALYLAMNMDKDTTSKTLYFSLEMNKEKLRERMHFISDKCEGNRIMIEDSFPQSASSIVNRVYEVLSRSNTGMVIIDYYQLLSGLGADDLLKLKRMAMDLSVLVVVLSQVSKDVDEREDKCPQVQDLRIPKKSMDQIDTVLFLYRANENIEEGS